MIRKRLLWICVLIVPTLALRDTILSCSGNCLNEVDEGIPLSCREIAIDNPSELQCDKQDTVVIPARKPEDMKLSWYFYELMDGSKIPALNVTWWINMQVRGRPTLDLKGFVVRFYQDAICEPKKFDFNINLSDSHQYADVSRLYFQYLCYGTSNMLEPGKDIFTVEVSSLPESFNKEHSSVAHLISLPSCEDKNMKKTKQCLEKTEILQPTITATSETPEINIPPDRSISVGFIVGSLSAAILVVVIVLLYKTTFQSRNGRMQLPKVFVVNNINDKFNNDQVQKFIEDLSYFAKVDSFLRSTNLMLENGWLENKMEEAHCLVFVASSFQADSENEDSILLQTYNCARAQHSVLKLGVYFAQRDISNLPRFVDKHSHACKFVQKFKKDIMLSNISLQHVTSNLSDTSTSSEN